MADSPTVRTAVVLTGPSRTATLQPYAEQVRVDTDTDFVVVMGLDRIRYTHPNPDNIGKQFVGDLGDAPEGEVFTAAGHRHARARRSAPSSRSATATRSSRWSRSGSR